MNNLLNKIKFIFVLIYLFVSMMLYLIVNHFNRLEVEHLIKENLTMAKAINQYITNVQKPIIYGLIEDGKLDKDYFNPQIMSSTYIVSKIQNNFNNSKDGHHIDSTLEYKFASDNPTNSMNEADEFELKILEKFRDENLDSYSEIINRNNQKTMFYALAVEKNSAVCLRCHGNPQDAPSSMVSMYGNNGFHEKIGDLHAINVVYASMNNVLSMWEVYLVLNFFSLIVFVLIYFTLRYFFIELNSKDKLLSKQSRFAALGEMISMIAHQWRQPLTGMSMSINNLLLDYELGDVDEKRSKDTLEIINKQIAYLSTTIDDFKNFFKPDIKSNKVNLKLLVSDSCMIIDSSLRSAGIIVQNNIKDDIIFVTKKNDVIQIILNLVKNSMDAYKENSIKDKSIVITAQETNKTVSIIIKDSAGGIPQEIIEKIFDPYFSTKDKKNGTGLGLYMSKMIVEDHLAGELSVKTEDISTIFTIKLAKELS